MPRRRRDAMGMRKLKIKKILKNTFYRKSNGNLISQLKILIQNRAVFETSSTDNFFSPKIECTTPTFLDARDHARSNGMGVVHSIALVQKSTFSTRSFSSVPP